MTTVLTTTPTQIVAKPVPSTLFDWLKPRRSVAITRLKSNGFALVVTLLVTQLAPIVPSATTCVWMLLTGAGGMSSMLRWICWMELTIYAILTANIVQSYVALRYPPPPCDPISTPAKRAQVHTPPPTRPLKGFAPKLSQIKSSSISPFSSPAATPPRAYNSPLSYSSPSPFQTSLNSSFATSLMSSPLAHRSRQSHSQPVRSLRSSLLNQFDDADDDDL